MGLGAAERGAIVGEPSSPGYAHMAVHLALDLVLKNAVGLGQLTRNNEDLAAVRELAQFGMKDDVDRRRIGVQACLPVASIRNDIPVLCSHVVRRLSR